jgi:hypothetical protein
MHSRQIFKIFKQAATQQENRFSELPHAACLSLGRKGGWELKGQRCEDARFARYLEHSGWFSICFPNFEHSVLDWF